MSSYACCHAGLNERQVSGGDGSVLNDRNGVASGHRAGSSRVTAKGSSCQVDGCAEGWQVGS